MSNLFGVPVHAAYFVVTALAGAITPLAGGLAVALAIVVFTVTVRLLLLPLSFHALRGQVAQSRLAPQIRALRQRHRKDPDRMTREVKALYRAEGTSMFAGYLPLLLQWPFLSVMYLLFRSGTINGAPNTLLRHNLFGAELGAHWLSGASPLSPPGAVFAGLFALLALTGYISVRVNRRLFPRPTSALSTVPTPTKHLTLATTTKRPISSITTTKRPTPTNPKRVAAGSTTHPTATSTKRSTTSTTTGLALTSTKRSAVMSTKRSAVTSSNRPTATSTRRPAIASTKRPASTKTTPSTSVRSSPTPSWLTNVLPLVTVVFAAFLPLAGGLYLLTTTAWTLLERWVLAHYVLPATPPPAPATKSPAAVG
jgi:YidC/Oxa1 family membrane protein insertase